MFKERGSLPAQARRAPRTAQGLDRRGQLREEEGAADLQLDLSGVPLKKAVIEVVIDPNEYPHLREHIQAVQEDMMDHSNHAHGITTLSIVKQSGGDELENKVTILVEGKFFLGQLKRLWETEFRAAEPGHPAAESAARPFEGIQQSAVVTVFPLESGPKQPFSQKLYPLLRKFQSKTPKG